MRNDFRVAIGGEDVAACGQRTAKLPKVIDLTVVDAYDVAALVKEWLPTTDQIDDSQPAHTKTDVVAEPKPVVVRASMDDASVHGCDEFPRNDTPVEVDYADNSTHVPKP